MMDAARHEYRNKISAVIEYLKLYNFVQRCRGKKLSSYNMILMFQKNDAHDTVNSYWEGTVRSIKKNTECEALKIRMLMRKI